MNFDTQHPELMALVCSLRDLEKRAAQQYRPLVEDILRTGSWDTNHIERTLDGLLDFWMMGAG